MRKIAKMRGLPLPAGSEDSGARTMDGTDRTRLLRPRVEDEAKARRPTDESTRTGTDKTVKLADTSSPAPAGKRTSLLVPGLLGALVVAGAGAYFVMSRSPQPAVATAPKATAPAPVVAPAKPAESASPPATRESTDVEDKAKRDAAEKANREAEAQAKRESEAQARREAELKAKGAAKSQARRDSDLKATREAEARAQREASAKAQREAEAKAQRETEAKAQRDAEAKANLAAESSFWESIKASRDPADFQKYLSRYPNGPNAEPARKRLARVEQEKRVADERLEKTRLEAERRGKLAAERARVEAERKKDAAARKPSSVVVPTF